MKKQNWFERLVGKFGGGRTGRERASGESKHSRGKQKTRGWKRSLRVARKRQRQARKAQRGR